MVEHLLIKISMPKYTKCVHACHRSRSYSVILISQISNSARTLATMYNEKSRQMKRIKYLHSVFSSFFCNDDCSLGEFSFQKFGTVIENVSEFILIELFGDGLFVSSVVTVFSFSFSHSHSLFTNEIHWHKGS